MQHTIQLGDGGWGLGRYEEAVDLLERNFKAVAHQVGPEDSLTFGPLMRLAHLHYAEEQYGRAGSFLDQVLGIVVGSEAKCDELLCEPLALKAMCEAGLGREKQAEGFARSAVEVALKYYAPSDVTTGGGWVSVWGFLTICRLE